MDNGVSSSYLLRIIRFLRIAYGLANVFHDIRSETSACAKDGPPAVPKTDMGVCLVHTRPIPCLGIG